MVCTAVSCQVNTQWYYAFPCQVNVNYFSLFMITNLLSIGTSHCEEQKSSLYPKSHVPPPPPQRMTGGRQYGPTVIGSCGCVPTLPTVKKYKTCQGKTARLYGFYIIVHITVSSQFYWTIL